jgi:hypothetical protein
MPCSDCSESITPAGGIEKDERIVSSIRLIPLSLRKVVVAIRTRNKCCSVNVDALHQLSVSSHATSTDGDITTVVFLCDATTQTSDICKLVSCRNRMAGDLLRAHGAGGVWGGITKGCQDKDCDTPCRDADCGQVSGECWAKLDGALCGGEVDCYRC